MTAITNEIPSTLEEQKTVEPTSYGQYVNGEWQRTSGILRDEMMLSLFINGQELVTILCTPEKLNCLVIGFLRSEGLTAGRDEIAMMRICVEESLAEVRLTRELSNLPTRRLLTSGCGGGTTFDQGLNVQRLSSSWSISPAQILSSIRSLQTDPKGNWRNNGVHKGVHVSALSDGDKLVIGAEDIGRHNTIDKIWGQCMLTRTPTADLLLVTTGRVSSEILLKSAKMGIPVIASLNSATNRAVKFAVTLGITVVGYARNGRLSVYSHPEHIIGCPVW